MYEFPPHKPTEITLPRLAHESGLSIDAVRAAMAAGGVQEEVHNGTVSYPVAAAHAALRPPRYEPIDADGDVDDDADADAEASGNVRIQAGGRTVNGIHYPWVCHTPPRS